MIKLSKTEDITIYQVKMVLEKSIEQHPFIAILILCKEKGYINTEILQQYLLNNLPIAACNNLLKRLKENEYLIDYYGTKKYQLTEKGIEAAKNKEYFVKEEGLYNLYIADSIDLIPQEIIKIERIERGEEDTRRSSNFREDNDSILSQYQDKILYFNNRKYTIKDIDYIYVTIPTTESYTLEIESDKNISTISIIENKEKIFSVPIDYTEIKLKSDCINHQYYDEYDESNDIILSPFTPNNISLFRNLTIYNPIIMDYKFDNCIIENVAFIPSDIIEAQLWLNELIFRNINEYFFDDASFYAFIKEEGKYIYEHYNIPLPSRKDFARQINDSENSFYKIAKLEAIDYLNY